MHKTERSTKRQRKNAASGFFDEKSVAGSAGPEARYGSVRTGAYTNGGKAKRHEPPPSHRLTVPHNLSFTTSAKRGLISRRVTTRRFGDDFCFGTKINGIGFPIVQDAFWQSESKQKDHSFECYWAQQNSIRLIVYGQPPAPAPKPVKHVHAPPMAVV